jgi:hypothetical protein
MANLYNSNEHININDVPIVSWKGQTFSQITSVIRKNTLTDPSMNLKKSNRNLFLPNPLKIYRREIASKAASCNTRVSSKIDIFDQPGGSIVYATSSTGSGVRNGLANTLDINLTTNKSQRPGSCSSCKTLGVSDADNARRRCRSSGNVKRAFNPSNNTASYYTDAKQYLTSRNKTFQQNQYYYLRQGNSNAKPGDNLSIANLYSANGTAVCPKYYIANDLSFQYQWIDQTYNTVGVSGGHYYNTEDINSALQQTMINNGHFYVQNDSNSKIFLANISYNTAYSKVELQTSIANSTVFPVGKYTISYLVPTNVGHVFAGGSSWTTPVSSTSPRVSFKNATLANILGFSSTLNYPTTQSVSSNQDFLSPNSPLIGQSFAPIYYKPNNPQFAQQGAVTASSLIARKKYDSITNSTANYRNAYGLQVANALAYGVPENGYTIKDKIGYPNKKTPVVTSTGAYKTCEVRSFVHKI